MAVIVLEPPRMEIDSRFGVFYDLFPLPKVLAGCMSAATLPQSLGLGADPIPVALAARESAQRSDSKL